MASHSELPPLALARDAAAGLPARVHARAGRARGVLHEYGPPALALALALAAWEAGVHVFEVKPFLLPAPSAIAAKAAVDARLLAPHALVTLREIAIGYVVAVAAGLALAAAIVQSRLVERVIYPFLVGSQTVPKVAVAPLLIIWLGAGLMPKVLIVAITAFFPITINAVAGLRSADGRHLDLMRSVAASQAQTFRRVRLPFALPFVFAGLKLATTLSVLGAIVAEFMGASEGLGYLILSSTFSFEVARVFVTLVVLVAIGIGFFGLVSWLDRRLSWQAASNGSSGDTA